MKLMGREEGGEGGGEGGVGEEVVGVGGTVKFGFGWVA